MADRGRKAFPVSSHVCDERWQQHCKDLHKQRLSEMKHRIDTEKPETFDMELSKGKRAMLEKERQYEIDRENAILLQKMVRIKEQDTRAVFRPWTARSTFQWKLGHYYDPTTGTKTLDHINLTSSVSPRSIHYYALSRPGTAPPDVTARMRDMQVQSDNTKLLRTITTMRSRYSVDDLERRHVEESVLVNRISNYRGPENARYNPPGRSASASRRSPYLQPLPGQHRASSSARGSRASPGPTAPPLSQQRYLEEAQSRDIPPPLSRGGSRPGTAIIGTRGSQEGGLGATSPRGSDGDAARRMSGSAAGSRPSSVGRGGAGQSFSFGAKEQQKKKALETSGDDYGDDQYEADEDQYEADADQEQQEAEKEEEDGKPAAQSSAGGGDEEEAGGDSYEEEAEEEGEDAAGTSGGADEEEEPATTTGYDEPEAEDDEDLAAAAAGYDEGGESGEKEEEENQDEEANAEADDAVGDGERGSDDVYAEPQAAAENEEAEAGLEATGEEEAEEEGTAEEEAKEEEEEQKAGAGESADGFEADAGEGLQNELENAEQQEMESQFAAEMAVDASPEDKTEAALMSPQAGNFAGDWD